MRYADASAPTCQTEPPAARSPWDRSRSASAAERSNSVSWPFADVAEARFIRCPHCKLPHPAERRTCPFTGGALEPSQAPPPTASRDRSLVGTTIDFKYEILEQVGEGSMGTVYRAENVLLQRSVALKVLQQEVAQDPLVRKRFLKEAELTASIEHRNVVRVWDAGVADGAHPFIVMEHVDGETLAARIARRGPLPLVEVVALARQIFEGLRAAHQVGVLHRDVKPENVILAADDTVKLVDFGIAQALADERTVLTLDGQLVGTPRYLSPEQAIGKELTPTTDAWSATVLVYQMLTGELPFEAPSVVETLDRVLNFDPPPPSALRPDLPREADDLVRLGLNKDPAARCDVGTLQACLQAIPLSVPGSPYEDTLPHDQTLETGVPAREPPPANDTVEELDRPAALSEDDGSEDPGGA